MKNWPLLPGNKCIVVASDGTVYPALVEHVVGAPITLTLDVRLDTSIGTTESEVVKQLVLRAQAEIRQRSRAAAKVRRLIGKRKRKRGER